VNVGGVWCVGWSVVSIGVVGKVKISARVQLQFSHRSRLRKCALAVCVTRVVTNGKKKKPHTKTRLSEEEKKK
jgi:hypothetical protein